MIAIAQTLAARVTQARSLEKVRKKDLHAGDRLLVTTRNSVYTIWVLDEGVYWVSGGWFDLSSQIATENGRQRLHLGR